MSVGQFSASYAARLWDKPENSPCLTICLKVSGGGGKFVNRHINSAYIITRGGDKVSNKFFDGREIFDEKDQDIYTNRHGEKDLHCGNMSLCQKFAEILKSTILTSQDGLCAVTRARRLRLEIAGRPTKSPLAINALFSFESMDSEGNTLNLGETVVLQPEINPFITALREQGIQITGLHNHWLFDKPRAMYIHWFSIEPPLVYARKVAKAFSVLEKNS